MTQIIAFAGTKQSGKTTCSEAILNYLYSKNYASGKIYNFADPLKKDICMNILGLSYDQCYGTDDDKNTLTNNYWQGMRLTARQVMQFVGTDIFRKMQKNVWSEATITKIKTEQPKLAIIADCRFPNEVDAIKNAGGIVIRLTRKPFHSDHPSENALEPPNFDWNNFDLVVHNNSMNINEQQVFILSYLQNKGILPL